MSKKLTDRRVGRKVKICCLLKIDGIPNANRIYDNVQCTSSLELIL